MLRCSRVVALIVAGLVSLRNPAVAWRFERGCECFKLVRMAGHHCRMRAGMWLATRSQLEQFVSNPFWNKTIALAANISDKLGDTAGWRYPGTCASSNSLGSMQIYDFVAGYDMRGHWVGIFALCMQSHKPPVANRETTCVIRMIA